MRIPRPLLVALILLSLAGAAYSPVAVSRAEHLPAGNLRTEIGASSPSPSPAAGDPTPTPELASTQASPDSVTATLSEISGGVLA